MRSELCVLVLLGLDHEQSQESNGQNHTGNVADSAGRSAEELLRKVRAARFVAEHGDQVCPAAWQPGEETLTPSLDLVGLL